MEHELDARGLLCPLPVLKAKRLLNQLQVGDVLCVRATDPRAPEDFALFCRQSGHVLLETTVQEDVHVLRLRRS